MAFGFFLFLAALPFLLEMPLSFLHVGIVPPALWALAVHGCAGALAGLSALLITSLAGSTEAFQTLKGVVRSVKFTAVTKAASSMTYVVLREGIGALSLGWSGIVFAAAGTGVVATAVQSGFVAGSPDFFRDNVAKNVIMFEAFWLTYAALSLLSPVCSITWVGLAISGTISGFASSLAVSIELRPLEGVACAVKDSFRSSLSRVRRLFSHEQMPRLRDDERAVVTCTNVAAYLSSHWIPAISTGVLNCVYMGVYWTLA